MDRRLFMITATGAVFTARFAHAQQRLLVNSPDDGYLNLRSGPGSKFDIIRRMTHGSEVEVMERAGSWVRVRHQSGAVGWCSTKFLASYGPSPFYVIYSPSDGYLNLRSGPGTSYDIIRRMKNGQEVKVLENAGDWVRVRHQSGAVGWCSAKYLRK